MILAVIIRICCFFPQRRKHYVPQSRFLSWEHARDTDYRNEVKDWIGGKVIIL